LVYYLACWASPPAGLDRKFQRRTFQEIDESDYQPSYPEVYGTGSAEEYDGGDEKEKAGESGVARVVAA
jgi:hypothetical protein